MELTIDLLSQVRHVLLQLVQARSLSRLKRPKTVRLKHVRVEVVRASARIAIQIVDQGLQDAHTLTNCTILAL